MLGLGQIPSEDFSGIEENAGCPPGYYALNGRGPEYKKFRASLEECRVYCDQDGDQCMSFRWNPKDMNCQLNRQPDPRDVGFYEEIFCSKGLYNLKQNKKKIFKSNAYMT